MDFITNLPPSTAKTTIWVIVDRLSKYAHLCALPSSVSATQLASHFIQEYVRLHGFPRSTISDRDRIFTSHFWKELFRLQGTRLRMSSAYHPQTDGQSEVVNRCFETYLRALVGDSLPNGPRTSHGPNGGTIPPNTHLSTSPLSRLFMVDNRPSFQTISWVTHKFQT